MPLIEGDGQEVELVPVVVVRQPGRLLECRRLKVDLGLGAQRKMLLAPCDQRLLEPAADGLAAEEP